MQANSDNKDNIKQEEGNNFTSGRVSGSSADNTAIVVAVGVTIVEAYRAQ
jgi:hypothetical protein